MIKTKINILVVEDNEDHLHFIKKALSDEAYVLQVITTGTAAFNYLLNPKTKPDIVLLDNHLPGMKGLEILKKLGPKKKDYNFIFITVDKIIDTVVEAMNLGAADFLVKTPNLKYELPQKVDKVYKLYKDKEEQLETEANFKSIIESTSDSIWSVDKNYSVITFNQVFKNFVSRVFNIKLKKGDNLLEVLPKEIVDFWKLKYDKALLGERVDVEFSPKNISVSIFFEVRLSPILVKGDVVGVSTISRNITKRKKIEHQLLKSQQLANLGSYTLDILNDKWYNSPTLDIVFGIDANFNRTLEGWVGLVHLEDRAIMQDYFLNKVLKNRSLFNKEYRIIRLNDKKERWVHGLGELVLNKEGVPIKMMGTIQDITERKLAEEALKNSEQLYRNVFQNAPLGIFHFNFKGMITDCNDEFVSIIGSSYKKLIGLKLIEQLHDKKIIKAVKQTLKTGTAYYEDNYTSVTAQKTTPLVIHFKAIQDVNNKIIGGVGLVEDVTERKVAIENLKEERDKFNFILEELPLGLSVIDANNKFIYLNQKSYELEGYPKQVQNLLGKHVFKAHPKNKYKNVENLIQDFVSGKKSVFTREVKRGKRFLEISYHAIRDSKQEYKGIVRTVLDITERKVAEKKLFMQSQQMASIYDMVTDIIFYLSVDAEGLYRFVSINNAFTTAIGVKKQDIIGKRVDTIIPEPALSLVLKKYKEAIDKRTIVSWEETTQYATGLKIADVSVSPIFNNKGICTHLVGSVHDITERKQNEQKLIKSETRYKTLIKKAPICIHEIDKTGNITSMNPEGLKMMNVKSESDICGLSYLDAVCDKDRPLITHLLTKAFKGEASSFEFKAASEVTQYFSSSFVPIIDNLGEVIQLMGITQDITKRKKDENVKDIIYNITKKAHQGTSLKLLFKFIQSELGKIINTKNFFIALYDATTDMISTPYMVDDQDDASDFPKGKSLTGYIIDSKKSLLANPTVFKNLEREKKITILGPLSKSWAGIPLIIENQAIGAIVIQSYTEENAYTQDDISLLKLVASHISQVIKQSQDFEKTHLLNQAILQSPEAVIITNTKSIIEYVNPAFTALSGYTSKEAIGQNPRILKSGVQDENFYKKVWKSMTKKGKWKGEFVNKRKDGSRYLVSANISAVKGITGEVSHYIGIQEDITEKRKLEHDFVNAFIEAQEAEKKSFGEDLHDGISQILAAESMYIDILIKQNQDRIEGKTKFLTKVKELNLSAINEARNISHGLMAKQLEEQGLLKATENICKNYNDSRNINFSFTCKEIKENEINKEIKTNIFRILQEMTTNIVRHSAATKASINISKTPQNNLKILVKDDGVGIDFDKMKRDNKGAGLKNMERRVTLLNGKMKVTATPDKGTQFSLEVPLESIL